jgi:radical SAM enzyme (TIGR01210 family)
MAKREIILKRINELHRYGGFKKAKLMDNDPQIPSFVETAPANVLGEPSQRQVIVLRTPACQWAEKDPLGGCIGCGFKSDSNSFVTYDDYLAQLQRVTLNKRGRVSLCTAGSAFDPRIPFEFWKYAMKWLRTTGIQEVDMEATAADVIRNVDRIKELRDLLGKPLNFGVGLESSNDFIRKVMIRKPLELATFEKAVACLGELDVGVFAYLMLKPPGLEEKEAIEDCVNTIRYFFALSSRIGLRSRINLKPFFVARSTVAEMLFEEGLTTPPKLWSLISVLKQVHDLGKIFIPLTDEGLSNHRDSKNCRACTIKVREAINEFNAFQDIKPIQELYCECKSDWEKEVEE